MKKYTFTSEEAQEIRAAREKNRDKKIDKRLAALEMRAEGKQIYYVLRRHGWRKVMPRSKHPKKAGDEVIATSKKLTLS